MPTIPCLFITTLAAMLLATGLGSEGAHAQDCLNWGDLDKKLYCDESRDLVADTPSHGYQLQDPDTLVFSYAPDEDSSIGEKTFSDFMSFLSRKTDKKVRWFDAGSSASLIKAMRAGEVHLAGIAPGPTVYAVNLAGFVPIAVMCRADGTFNNMLNLIATENSSIDTIHGLKGRKVALASALANNGGLRLSDYRIELSGSESKSIEGVRDGGYDAALVDSGVLERADSRGDVDASHLRVLWESVPFPPISFGFAHNLAPDLQRKLHDAFLTFEWKGTELALAFGAQADRFCTVTYEETWESIRVLQKNDGVVYRVEDL